MIQSETQVKKQEQPILPAYFEDAIKRIVYDSVLEAMESKNEPAKVVIEIPPIYGFETLKEVTGFASSTIYRNTSKNLMPHYRRDGKLFFKRDEIYNWLTENRVKTQSESIQEMDEKFLTKKRRN
jgi:predicted DNA-binding transcriptional regulator AlpA